MYPRPFPPDATFTFIDKAAWKRGPWDSEPDKIVWVDKATGLDCMIHRGPGGALCGYVGVSEGHPLFKRVYHDVHAPVHGGLTFSAPCSEDGCEITGRGICHDPQPGRPEHVWWFGFDCAHSFDYAPGFALYGFASPDDEYRDIEYLVGEVQGLAANIKDRED